jgi:hypothetical protein
MKVLPIVLFGAMTLFACSVYRHTKKLLERETEHNKQVEQDTVLIRAALNHKCCILDMEQCCMCREYLPSVRLRADRENYYCFTCFALLSLNDEGEEDVPPVPLYRQVKPRTPPVRLYSRNIQPRRIRVR